MSVIAFDIETALAQKGIEKITLKTQIAPAWTTDWLSKKGRARLEDYGIAPPQVAGGPERCPQCKSTNVNGSANLDPPHVKHNGGAKAVWSRLIISNVFRADLMVQFHELKVSNIQKTIRDAVVVSLQPVNGADFSFVQGQYLTFRRDFDGEELRRSYSICAGQDEGILQVGIKRVDGGHFPIGPIANLP